MRIATKLNAGILAVLGTVVVTDYAVMQSTIRPQFEAIEQAASKVNHQRVHDAFDILANRLRSSTQDWAFWDPAYAFATGADNNEFLAENLPSPIEALNSLKIDALIFTDTAGKATWAKAIDFKTKVEEPGLIDEILRLGYRHPYLSGGDSPEAVSGLVGTSNGILQIAVAPLLKSDRSGKSAGMLVMASKLDAKGIGHLTSVTFHLDNVTAATRATSDTITSNTGTDAVETSSLLTDIVGRPLRLLHVVTPREVSRAGIKAIQSATFLMVGASAAVIVVLWLLVRLVVVSRVDALKQHFTGVAATGELSATELTSADDEISELAQSFNEMAEHVNYLRDALADNAYRSGLSEWAAGTLHNVRNGLSPINASAQRLNDLAAAPWLKNVESAVDQLKAPTTTSERRSKLEAYLVEKGPSVVDLKRRVAALAVEVRTACHVIAEIASDYERYSRRRIDVERIDVRSLVESVARSTVGAASQDVRVALPAVTAAIETNRIILRQILGNLLINALEAMQGSNAAKSIAISLRLPSKAAGGIEILVTDTGHGIAPENMKRLFERGFSTRKEKRGGLGLHWCANAAKALGGSLRAESAGAGKGATLVLTIPQRKLAREAA